MLLVNEKLKPFYKILAGKHTRDHHAEARYTFKGDLGFIFIIIFFFKLCKEKERFVN